MKQCTLMIALIACTFTGFGQDEEEEKGEKRGFKKENIFAGGSVSLSFGSRSFMVGANPMLGYKIAEWLDAGIVFNYQYTTFRDYTFMGDKLRQNIYGGGVFTRIYPVNFLFAQAQFEHNFIKVKYIPSDNTSSEKYNTSGNSFLVGAGYSQGRIPGMNNTFFYLSLLWDVSNSSTSPYTNSDGKPVAIYRAGINAFLFRQ
jgi:hypothetical protein